MPSIKEINVTPAVLLRHGHVVNDLLDPDDNKEIKKKLTTSEYEAALMFASRQFDVNFIPDPTSGSVKPVKKRAKKVRR
jgi:hypothetical protein